ncbi:MAG: C45 family autoproteolytic acyltransferase/hydrolase [Candidatus Heimdallarchaeota archaeon]
MTEEYEMINKKYHYVVLEGTSYEVGKQQAEMIKDIQPLVQWMLSGKSSYKKQGFANFESLQNHFEEFCPGITEELQGFADGLGVKPVTLTNYGPTIYTPGKCSLMTATSSVTKNNHIYMGRSYEFNDKFNDFRLICLKIKNKIRHMGFSEFFVYRDDGMNDQGLSVSISSGGVHVKKVNRELKKGFPFFLAVRSILENCTSVKDAINYLEKVPIHGFWNFLVNDKNSNAVLFQFFDGEFDYKMINNETEDKILHSTNHYVLPKMKQYEKYAYNWAAKNSLERYDIINKALTRAQPNITKETIRKILSTEIYDGVCCHYYKDFMGTLFSIIFDVTELKAEVCFGAPTHNKWHTFDFDDSVGVKVFDAVLPNKSFTLDKFCNIEEYEKSDVAKKIFREKTTKIIIEFVEKETGYTKEKTFGIGFHELFIRTQEDFDDKKTKITFGHQFEEDGFSQYPKAHVLEGYVLLDKDLKILDWALEETYTGPTSNLGPYKRKEKKKD